MEFCFPWYLRGLKTISKIIARNPSYAFSLNCCILTIRMENILTIFSFTVFYFEDLVWFFWSSLYGSIPLNCEGKVFGSVDLGQPYGLFGWNEILESFEGMEKLLMMFGILLFLFFTLENFAGWSQYIIILLSLQPIGDFHCNPFWLVFIPSVKDTLWIIWLKRRGNLPRDGESSRWF